MTREMKVMHNLQNQTRQIQICQLWKRLILMMKPSNLRGSPEQTDTNLDLHIHEEHPYATRMQKNHSSTLVIGDVSSPMLTRKMCNSAGLKDLQSGLLACFLSQNETKKVHEALKESS